MPSVHTDATAANGTVVPGEQDANAPIAIVGMACRFPGDATSPTRFFDMLAKGRAAWSEIPKDRYNVDAFWHPNHGRQGTTASRGGHFMKEDLGLFDAPFFNISAAEATALDPQVRLLLEVAYESLENGGIPMESIAGSETSCYIGCSSKDYDGLSGCDIDDTPLYEAIGAGYAMLANRVSHFFDLHGPSITLDTACSSSLIALHLACQSIRSGESRMSVIGSSQMILMPGMPAALSSLHFLSPDSRCYSFDDRANGYARGEGVCVMVLKPLEDALRDGDTIRAVIRGSGTNQDGKTPGITQPSSDAQAALIRSTYKAAGLDYSHTQYFEAHGTGTPVGDPLELGALGATFGAAKRDTGLPLYVGSVKTNIGHLEAGAGLAGLIKSVLSLENAVIPQSLNFENPNPRLRLDEWNLKVPTKLIPWPTNGVRRASVNSFGYGGSNAHCIIDDAYNYLKIRGLQGNTNSVPAPNLTRPSEEDKDSSRSIRDGSPLSSDSDSCRSTPDGTLSKVDTDSTLSTTDSSPIIGDDNYIPSKAKAHPRLFVLSSPEQDSVQRLASSYADYLKEKVTGAAALAPEINLDDLAFTLGIRRSVFPWRASFVASSSSDLASSLTQQIKANRVKKPPKTLFVFTGQGAQWHAMGRELMAYEVYARTVEEADKYLTSLGADWSVLSELTASEENSQISLAKFSQPLCCVLQIALVNLLDHWGVKPAAVVGHSSGEIAAAYAAGALSAQDCWKVAYHRGRLSHAVKEIAPSLDGAMMAVGLSEKDVQPYLDKLAPSEVAIVACVNSPSNVTVSGDSHALKQLEDLFQSANVFARRLKVENAYHSPHMQVIADDYYASIESIQTLAAESAPTMVSSVTGVQVATSELDASYWVRNMVSPVQFEKAISAIVSAAPSGARRRRRDGLAIDTLLEIGPHSALQGPLKQILTAKGKVGTTYLALLQRGQDAAVTALDTLGQLWTKGESLDFLRVNSLEADPKPLVCLTDVPSYPWNHSRKYWHEPLPSVNFRFGKSPRLDLLGKPMSGNPHDLTWANVIRLSEIPWVADHCVEGDILFPAAGMLCAVLEAARQLADKTKTVLNYELRDILINRAFIVPPDEGISMVLHMKPRKIGTKGTNAPWLEFTVYSQSNDGEYTEHCSGLLQISYSSDMNEKERVAEAAAEWKALQDDYADAQRICTGTYTPEYLYDVLALKNRDMYYGPMFQCVTKIKYTDMIACTTIEIQDTKAAMPEQFEYDHLLHPITLDGFLQSFGAAVGPSEGSLVPTSIDSLVVSANLPKGSGAEFRGFVQASRHGFRNYGGTIVMSDESWNEPKVMIKGYGATELSRSSNESTSTSSSSSAIRKMCSQLVWKEDLSHVGQIEAEQLFRPERTISTDHAAACAKAAVIYMARTISLAPEVEAAMPPHLTQYLQWMRRRVGCARLGELDYQHGIADWLDLSTEAEEAFLASIAKGEIDGRLLCAVGESLRGILDGSVPPLPLMMKDNMLFDFYSNTPSNSMVAKYLDLQGHKRPDYKILEVGAGTGSITLPILETLGGRNGTTPRFHRYVFSDNDSACLECAQKFLKDWQGVLEYKKLDIEKDPMDQGFEEESFDTIVAGNLLLATKQLGVTLANCHRLLKPGGRLVLAEFTRPLDRLCLVLGTLPSWWSSEDGRIGGPLIDEATWNRHLLASKFSGLDIVVKDTQDDRDHYSSMIVTTKPVATKLPISKVVVIEPPNPSEACGTLSANVSRKLSELGLEVEHATLENAAASDSKGKPFVSGKAVVSLVECENPFVFSLSETDFNSLKTVLIRSLGGLWIGRGGEALDPSGDPSFCASTGLFRVLRGEHPDIRMHEFNFSSQMQVSRPEAADLVGRAFKSIVEENPAFAETEISEINGRLYIPRLYDEKHKNHSLQMHGCQPEPQLQPFFQAGRPLKLTIGSPGQLDTLHFIDDLTPLEPLTGTDVEIEIHASAMNFVDIMVTMGLVADTQLGADAAGIIKRVGPDVTLVKPGDRVATTCFGTYCSLMRVPETLLQKVPDHMTMEEGATLCCAYVTAYQSLVEIGRLERGETLLIHSAAGGLGQAAIQLAKHIGAEIFVTASSAEKRRLIMAEYDIPADHIFNSRDLAFAKGIMRMTHNKGVDVILNSLAGDALRKSWECIAQFGRFIEVGKKDILGNTGLEMSPFLRNVTFACVNIEHMGRHNPRLMARLYQRTFDLIREGAVGLVKPITVYPYSEIEKAFRFMQQAKHKGKMVLKVHPDDMVPAIPRNPHPLTFDEAATYVLVGGLGGIGRAVATFMAEHGVKHLAFISRSGDTKPGAKEAIKELNSMGVHTVSYACDIADAATLGATITRMSAEMPRVKGVIQAAMVLQDMYFEEMTYKGWVASTRPKIQGTWNLHQLFPKDLEFFVMLSSISGISGNGAQSNYAAGNTYLDGLAHYRKAQGLAACSVDLGAIMGVGWMAENVNMSAEAAADWARISLQPHELFSLIESAMTGYSVDEIPMPTQMVTGAGTGGIGQQMERLKTSNAFDDPKYSYIRWLDVRGVSQTAEDSTSELKGALTAATSLAQAAELIEGGLAVKLSKSLSIALEDVDTSKPVYSYGVDSLVAIEMRNWIFKELKSQVSVFDILSKVPISQLAFKVARKSGFVPEQLQGSTKDT